MDLPYVRLVIQWRATCDMCDLWQRFGRAARAAGTEGTGILFHEKLYLDVARERKKLALATAQTKKKRKADEDGGRPAKRPATETGTSSELLSTSRNQRTSSDTREVETEDPAVADRQNTRNTSYAKRAQIKAPAKKSTKPKAGQVIDDRQELDVCGLLDDFINASTRPEIRCRRAPVKLYSNGPIRIPG